MTHRFIGATIWHVYVAGTPTEAPNSSTTPGPQSCDCSVYKTVAVTLVIVNAIAIVTFLWKRRQACQKLHSERSPDVVVMAEGSTSEYATVADVVAAGEGEPNKVVVGASATSEVIVVNSTYVSADKKCLRSGMPSNISKNRLTPAEDRMPEKDELDEDTKEPETPEQDAIDEVILGQETLYQNIPVLDTTVQEARDGDALEQETVYHEIPEPDRTEQDVLDEDTLEQDTPESDDLYEDISEIDTTPHNTLYNIS
ncbi:uncharacterized protein LOC124255503 [Haliotis rubra]|uniref:uncharacterized protein LOC124255503 n=1 Tax=Haliotis rubra TaxID=36100 RepID=UPI001EE4F7DE|nr:uncharacterized protein LOC124255503 [Haliotis rubra]